MKKKKKKENKKEKRENETFQIPGQGPPPNNPHESK